jgi:hypothetical protein
LNSINVDHQNNINNQYYNIRGSKNISGQLLSYGNSNKSITLNLSNFDTSYPYYQIGIIQTNGLTGVPNNVLLSEIKSINDSIYTYSGNDESLITGSLSDINVIQEVFEKVSCIEQLDNRLILANGSTKNVDFNNNEIEQ